MTKDWRHCSIHGDIDGATQWGCPDCVAQARKEIRERNERIRELEQEIDTHAGECHPQIESLEQQLKAAQDALPPWCSQCGKFIGERACGPTHAVLTMEWIERAKEYFAKHSPSSTTPCALTGCTETSWPHSHALRQP